MSLYPIYIGFISVLILCMFLYTGIYVSDISMLAYQNIITNGWKAFAFVSNYNHIIEQPIFFAWFNSVSFQLYILFYFVIKLLVESERIGLISAFAIYCLNATYLGYRKVLDNIPPYIDILQNDM